MILESVVSDAGRVERNSIVAFFVDCSGKHLRARSFGYGSGLTGYGRLVYRGGPPRYYAVKRDSLAGPDNDGGADRNFADRFFLDVPVIGAYEAGHRRGDIQKRGDFPFCLAYAP